MKTNNKEDFRRSPAQSNGQVGNYKGRYCQYHRMARHDTDNCRELREEVESLICRRCLQEFVAKQRRQTNLSRSSLRNKDPFHELNRPFLIVILPSRAEIMMMVGGNQYIEGSKSARRRQAQDAWIMPNYIRQNPQISTEPEWFWFTEGDSQWILQDQSDALVITMLVVGVKVHRILVDNGSSINVLYSRTLKQLEISERYLQPYTRRLQGFSGYPIETRGQIL